MHVCITETALYTIQILYYINDIHCVHKYCINCVKIQKRKTNHRYNCSLVRIKASSTDCSLNQTPFHGFPVSSLTKFRAAIPNCGVRGNSGSFRRVCTCQNCLLESHSGLLQAILAWETLLYVPELPVRARDELVFTKQLFRNGTYLVCSSYSLLSWAPHMIVSVICVPSKMSRLVLYLGSQCWCMLPNLLRLYTDRSGVS